MTRLLSILALGALASAVANELAFDATVREVDVAPDRDAVTVVFPFKNVSSQTVKLGGIRSTCDCTSAGYKGGVKELAPGASGVVEATMKTGAFSGTVDKELYVKAAGKEYRLVIRAVIPGIVAISPKKLEWKVGEDRSPKTIKVTLDPRLPMKLKEVSLTGKDFDYEPVTVKAGREYKVIVTPKTTGKASFNSLWIVTDSTVERYARFLCVLAVTPRKD